MNLNFLFGLLSFILFVVVFIRSFGGQKNQKPRHTESPVCLFFAQELPVLQHPSVKKALSANSFFNLNSLISFLRPKKEQKRPAHGPSSRSLLCSRCCRATSLVCPSLAAASLSAVCRVLRNALRAAILKKYNCRPTFERSSHNGLPTSGLSAVSVTVPEVF